MTQRVYREDLPEEEETDITGIAMNLSHYLKEFIDQQIEGMGQRLNMDEPAKELLSELTYKYLLGL
jgi:hypothetical protein